MKAHGRIIFGGLGALFPIIANLLAVDFETLLINLTVIAFAAYMLRATTLFSLGALSGLFHKNENSPIKLFELGIVAPAIITALLNAQQVHVPKPPVKPYGTPTSSTIFIPSAYAQTTQKEEIPPLPLPKETGIEEIETFSLPKETAMQQFWRGFTGSIPKNVWFVIVGSHLALEDAEQQGQEIVHLQQTAAGLTDFTPKVYAPYEGNPYYTVVIGANLIYKQAQQFRQEAINAGFTNTYLWTFPTYFPTYLWTFPR